MFSYPLSDSAEYRVAEYRNHHGDLVVTVTTSDRRDVPTTLQVQTPFLHLLRDHRTRSGLYYAARETSGHATAERLAVTLTRRRDKQEHEPAESAPIGVAAGEHVWLALRTHHGQRAHLVKLAADFYPHATLLCGTVVEPDGSEGASVVVSRLLEFGEISDRGRTLAHGTLIHLSRAGSLRIYTFDDSE